MPSRNPVLRHAAEQATGEKAGPAGFAYDEGRAAYTAATSTDALEQAYAAPSATALQTGRMSLDDVVVKTAISFVVLLVGAVLGWQTAASVTWLWVAAMFVGLGLGLANAFKKTVSPALVLAYAFVEGVFLGGISQWYQWYAESNGYQGSIVLQAVLGTLTAFAVMLLLYRSRVIKVDGTFAKVFLVAMASYLVIALASFVSAIFGVGGGWGFYGVGGLGIALCVLGVALAAFSLVMDFETIAQVLRRGAPERESWRMAFGLMATLIWLYLEILRLLAILSGRN